MQCVRFQNNARLSASMSVFIVIFLTNINFQVCKGSGASKNFSTSEECARQCQDESPKTCYYHFVLEYYTSNGAACNYCNVSETDPRINTSCQCIIGDGKEKTVFSINRMIPGPSIQVCNGDTLIIDVQNNADGIEAAIHWHGIFQNGYQYYDGTPYITQCPILSSNIFRYCFKVKNSGTHFYHSHVSTHVLDGQYGSLIVRDPPSSNPHAELYNYDLLEHVITISDWMHGLSTERMPGKYREDKRTRGQAAENFLINGRGNWTDPVTGVSTNVPLSVFIVQSGKKYRFRMINACSTICLIEVTIEDHSALLIATDGVNVKPIPMMKITMASAERVDFVLNANQTVGQYWIHVRGLGECEKNQLYQLAILSYQGASKLSLSPNPGYLMGTSQDVFNPLNSTNCRNDICVDQLRKVYLPNEDQTPMNQEADMRIILSVDFFNYSADIQNLLFNQNNREYKRFFVSPSGNHVDSLLANISYQHPPSPLISQNDGYQYMCGNSITCTEPCTCTNVYHIPLHAVVDVFIYDKKAVPLNHPFHLHGYSFCVLHSGQFVNPENKEEISDDDVNRELEAHSLRARNGNYTYCSPKDTVIVPTAGYTIIRFKADNPGWWLFHCHFAWHTATGMNVVFHVGNSSDLPPVPEGFPKCYNWKPKII